MSQKPFPRTARRRFQKLLRLASESPYPAERDNAFDAARRLAEAHGMSISEAARSGVGPESPPQPQSEPDVDQGAGRRRPRRTYWDEDTGGGQERSKAEWLNEYARMRRTMRKDMEGEDRSLALWLAFLIGAIFFVFGGVAFVLSRVGDVFQIVPPG